MRKLSSIALAVLILFNVLGYYGIFLGLDYKNTREITQRLNDDRYDESQTVLIKIPLSVPYAANSDYQRVDGEFTYEGEVYRLVKQKFSNDTLFAVCIIDHRGTAINQALTDYVKTFSDKPVESKSNQKDQFSFIKEYFAGEAAGAVSGTSSWERDVVTSAPVAVFIASFTPSVIHPPERA